MTTTKELIAQLRYSASRPGADRQMAGLMDDAADALERAKFALRAALHALQLPCDRWNKRQFEIVKAAILQIEAV